jgi:hypothetical protein
VAASCLKSLAWRYPKPLSYFCDDHCLKILTRPEYQPKSDGSPSAAPGSSWQDETEEHKEVPSRLGRGASRTLKLGMECDGHLGSEEGDEEGLASLECQDKQENLKLDPAEISSRNQFCIHGWIKTSKHFHL